MDVVELEHVFEERDLGVTVDSDMKFEVHTSTKVKNRIRLQDAPFKPAYSSAS